MGWLARRHILKYYVNAAINTHYTLIIYYLRSLKLIYVKCVDSTVKVSSAYLSLIKYMVNIWFGEITSRSLTIGCIHDKETKKIGFIIIVT